MHQYLSNTKTPDFLDLFTSFEEKIIRGITKFYTFIFLLVRFSFVVGLNLLSLKSTGIYHKTFIRMRKIAEIAECQIGNKFQDSMAAKVWE